MAVDDLRHPDAEELAEYAEGALDARARADVERHLAECAACRAVVMETMAFLETNPADQLAPAAVIPFRARRSVRGVALALAVAAALVAAVFLARPEWLSRPRGDRPELQELIAAVANEPTRPVEGRLTGGFKYAPPPPTTRGETERVLSPDVRIAVANIQKQPADSPRHDAALATAALVSGECDKALSMLETSLRKEPADPAALNDLSAAGIQCAQRRRGDPVLLANAVAAADRSIAGAPQAPEAYFNRALALELAGRSDEALKAWHEYLRIDPGSSWSAEAQRRIDQRRP